jgi:hypothetical protein
VTVRALDNAVPSNDEGYYSSRSSTFTFDNVAPSIVVQNPTDSSFFTNATPLTISGTAQDAVSGVQAVQVRIQNGANYWTGTHNAAGNFTTTQSTVTADLALLPTWQFIIPAGELTADFVQGQTYQFSARSWDVAGTTSAFTAIASAIYEIEAPTAAVTSPSAFSNAAPLTISGTAVDSIAGVFKVEVAISSSATAGNGTWYNGTSFSVDLTSNTVWRTTSTWTGSIPGTINWTWATGLTLTNNTTYSILLRTTDRAGNVYTQTLAERKTFLYDNASPSAGILDPDQPYERSLSIISGTAADSATPISGVEVAISTGASFDYYWSGSNWIQGPAIWMNASAGDGTFNSTSEDWLINSSLPTYINNRAYQVTVRPADAAGNKVNQYTASFVYDTVPATSAVTSPPLLTAYQSLALVTGTMSDAPNPAPQTVELTLMNPSNNFWNGSNFSSSTSVWLSAAQVYTTTWTYTNLPTSWNDRTIYTLFVRSIDRAGNWCRSRRWCTPGPRTTRRTWTN